MRYRTFLGVAAILSILIITIFSLEFFSRYQHSETTHLGAPVITREAITIDAPVEEVWKIFCDVEHWDDWQTEIVAPKINGTFNAGNSFNWKSNGLTITSTLQRVNVNQMVAWSGPAFGSFAVHTWHFKEYNGQTTVRVEESMEGWLVYLLKNKFQSSLDTSIANWLSALKARTEKVSIKSQH